MNLLNYTVHINGQCHSTKRSDSSSRRYGKNRAVVTPLTAAFWSTLTPLDLFSALAHDPSVFWLDSGANVSGWSYIGIQPARSIRSSTVFKLPLSTYTKDTAKRTNSQHNPPFSGGWITHLNYPANTIPFSANRALIRTAMQAHFFENVFAYSHATKTWSLVSNFLTPVSARNRRAVIEKVIHSVQNRRRYDTTQTIAHKIIHDDVLRAKADFIEATQRALKYIKSGDIYQVSLALCSTMPWSGTAAELYLRMRQQSPAAYGAFLGAGLDRDRHALCCISPELFLRTRNGVVVTRPIKGTRARGTTVAETAAARIELESSEKERAELNMIVDLLRNDLGRVCAYGSVRVDSSGDVEELPTLLHRTATVSGRLRAGTTVGDLLAATFPGGSITG
ncbi:MAG: chorismate-binding protein, partial [Planctomycetota bacterium]